NPNLAFEPGTTSGTFAHALTDITSADGDFNIDALHVVTHTLTVGTGLNTFTLLPGDVLFSTAANETLTSANTLAVGQDDVVIFRPDHPDDSSSGTLSILLNGFSAL